MSANQQEIPATFQPYNPAVGIDVGTYTIVRARRGASGDIEYLTEINGFLEVELNNRTRILRDNAKRTGVPIFTPENASKCYILGRKARNFAFSFGALFSGQDVDEVFKRTMRDGMLSTKDSVDAFNVLAVLTESMVSPIPSDGFPIAFSVPGIPVVKPGETADKRATQYHTDVITEMLKEIDGHKTDPFAVNEAEAIVWSECENENFTGIGMSFGAGMTNVSFMLFGMEVFSFSIVGGGDSIDRDVARRQRIDPVVANVIKMGDDNGTTGIDLTMVPTGANAEVESDIIRSYKILIGEVAVAFGDFVRKSGSRVMEADRPSVVVAGGTASPNGFVELLEEKIRAENLGQFKLGEFRKAPNNLYTVAKGLLRYAETRERN